MKKAGPLFKFFLLGFMIVIFINMFFSTQVPFWLSISIFIGFIIIGIYLTRKRNRTEVFKKDEAGIVNKDDYDKNLLETKLEKWSDYKNELGSNNVNKSIYNLEKRLRKLYTEETMEKYQDALFILEQILQVIKEEYNLSHPFYTLTLTNLGKLYQEIGKYTEARSHFEKALEVRKELLGENHPVVAQSMANLGKLYQEIGKYTEARSHFEKALEVRKELLGENHPVVAQSMANLGKLYQEIGNYTQGASLFIRSLEIKQKFPGRNIERNLEIKENFTKKDHICTAIDYTDFGYLYYEKGDYDKAKEFYNYAMDIWRSWPNYEMYPLESAVTVNNLGILYQEIGNYQDAEKHLKNGLEIRQKLLGENHPVVAQSMGNLGKLYNEIGDYNNAELLYQTSLDIILSSIGKTNKYFANLLTYRGKLYHDQVNYSQAEAFHKESLGILEKLQGINQLHIAQSMTNLGMLYNELGNFREAETYLKKGLEIRKNILGESHLYIAQSKMILAEVYLNIGDYYKADQYNNQTVEIRKNIFSRLKDTPEGLNYLASTYSQHGSTSEAIKLYKRSLDDWKKIGKKKNSGYATTLYKLGELYYDLGDFSKSEEYYTQALEIRQLIFSDTSPSIAQSMNNLAILYDRIHDYTKAEEYYKHALNILRSVFGDKNIRFARTLNNLAMLYAKTNRQDKAIELIKDVIIIEDELIGQVFSIASERQRMVFLNVINKNFHNFLSLTSQYFSNSKEEIKYALSLTIRRKGIGAEALTATRDAVLSGKYPEMESKLRELNIIRKQIARKGLDGKDENELSMTHNRILAEWNSRKENLEEELANKIPEIRLEQKLKSASLETITKFLPTETVLIELIKFNFPDFSNQNNNNDENNARSRYLAFVIYDNTTNDIQMIDLGDSEIIDNKIKKFRNTITGENPNRNLIPVGSSPKSSQSNSIAIDDLMITLSPLLKAIGNHKRIFIAPDGDFTKIPFELLQFDSLNRYILEDCLISYITTSRDLIGFNNSSIGIGTLNNSLVIADPDFDLVLLELQLIAYQVIIC